MTSFRKKLLLILFVLFASVTVGLGFLFAPEKPSADVVAIPEKYYKIENGVFNGLTDDAKSFLGSKNFTINLPATVTEIGDGNVKPEEGTASDPTANLLFGDLARYLTGVTFAAPENITKIGYRAFVNCVALNDIDLSGMSALTELEGGIFRECASLTEVTLPAGVTAVPEYTFRGCTALTSVEFEGTITSIGMSAFANCGSLNLTLPETLTSIGDSAFLSCSSLTSVAVPDSVESFGKSVFANCVNLLTADLHDGITEIPAGTFQNCYKLQNFEIPDTVTKIGDYAFSNCNTFTQVTVPAGITTIGLNAFYGLDGVTRINYYAVKANNVSAVPFAMSEDAYSRSQGVEVHIGDLSKSSVTYLATRLFDGHKAITKIYFNNVDLHNGAQEFGNYVFRNCTSLEEVIFGDNCNISLINVEAFRGCTKLQTVSGLENIGLKTIGVDAFYECRSLYTVTIGANVTAINEGAFLGCTRLIEVKNLSGLTITAGQKNVNGEVARYAKYVYGANELSRIDASASNNGYVFYANITNASTYEVWLIEYVGDATNLTLPYYYTKNGVQYPYNIYESAFMGNTEIMAVTMYNNATYSVKKIGESAFAGCTSLTSVNLPKDLQEVGENAFQGCTSLTEVNFNANNQLSTISDFMFGGCKALMQIEVPERVQLINSNAFSGCENLRTVTFKGNNVKTISSHAFDGCSALEVIKMPASVTTVEVSAFENCSNLKFVYLPTDAEYKTHVFNGCSEDLILISQNKTQYDVDKAKTNLSTFVSGGKLTYLVDLKLVYSDGCAGDDVDTNSGVHTIKRLFNMSGGLLQNVQALTWTEWGMPVQGGHDNTQLYSESKWFKESTYENEVDVAELTNMLAVNGVSEIRLYARYFAQPKLEALHSVPYEVGKEYSVKDILTAHDGTYEMFRLDGSAVTNEVAENLIKTFSISIINHRFVNGTVDDSWNWEAGKLITEAGTYTLSISLPTNGSYGGWANPKTVDFTITAGQVDITDMLVWNGLAPDTSETRTLYFYNGTTTPNLEPLEGQTPSETAEKSNSYTVYTDNEITISLDWIDSLHNYGTIGSYTGVTATQAGTYTATAVITPSNNYILTYKTDTATLERLRVTYGLSFDGKDDGTVVVTKTWYIAISDLNQLLSGDENVGGLYRIPAEWTYGDGSQIPLRPVLSKIPGQATEILKFTFKYTDCDGKLIEMNGGNEISISEYEKYFNSSMPAGDYEVTFFIHDGKDENGNNVTGDPAGLKYNFTVNEVTVTRSNVNEVKKLITNADVPYDSTEPRFLGTGAVASLNIAYQQKTPGSNYVWSNYPEYYTPFEIKYCVVSGNDVPDGKYLTEAEYNSVGNDKVKPEAIGTYTVYYIIQAPNHSTVIDGSYVLNITYTVRPVLSGFGFDGNNVLSGVLNSLQKQMGYDYYDIYTMLDYSKLSSSDSLHRETMSAPENLRIKYMASWGKNDSYSEIGTHYVFLKIKNEYVSYIRWVGTLSTEYYLLPVEIITSDNALIVHEWEFGRFDEAVNVPELKVSYGADTQYFFAIMVDGRERYVYYTDAEMNKYVEVGHTLKDAPVGTYTLVARAYANGKNFETETTITVHKVNINFTKSYLSGWTYGQITADTDLSAQIKNAVTLGAGIDAKVKDEIVLKFIEASRYEQGVAATATRLSTDASGFVPSGDYYVVLTRDEDDNYQKLSFAIKFSVLAAANHWDKTSADSVVANISIKKDAENSLYNLFKTHYGSADDMIIEIREQGGSEWRNVADSSFPYASVTGLLNIGDYEMRITVSGNNVAELVETISLKVVNPKDLPVSGNNPGGSDGTVSTDGGVSDTAVIATIIVFAVIAVAVVAVGAVIFVMKNKKANAEYIKTVKSEMKRR